MIFDVKITQSELNISSEIVSDKSLHFVVDFPIWIKGEKGDPFTYADFTAEQIKQLQQPAFEAATLANEATDKANTVTDKVIVIEGTVIKNEDKRIVNENTRIENEKERSDGFSSAITLIGNKVEASEKATTDATDAAKNAQETASHPTYIGDDHYVYRWNATEKEYYRTDIYSKGDTGLTAYEVAVKDGFVGTEKEWLQSLVGGKGNDGNNATINGVNTLTIKEGENVKVTQSGTELTISSEINEVVKTEIASKADKPIAGRTFLTPLFVARGAVFNDVTGFYELNGLTDITEEQIMNIYNIPVNGTISTQLFAYINARTMFPPVTGGSFPPSGAGANYAFTSSNFEVLCFSINLTSAMSMFRNCRYLRRIIKNRSGDKQLITNCDVPTKLTNMFYDCIAFEYADIDGLNTDISFAQSPLVMQEFILSLLTTRKNSVDKTITITLHPTVFAVASANSDVQALLPATTTKGEVLLASA